MYNPYVQYFNVELSLKLVTRMNIRFAQTLANICVAFCVYSSLWPPGRLLLYRMQIRNEPKLWNVPDLCHLGSRPSAGRKFSYFGYESIPLGLS